MIQLKSCWNGTFSSRRCTFRCRCSRCLEPVRSVMTGQQPAHSVYTANRAEPSGRLVAFKWNASFVLVGKMWDVVIKCHIYKLFVVWTKHYQDPLTRFFRIFQPYHMAFNGGSLVGVCSELPWICWRAAITVRRVDSTALWGLYVSVGLNIKHRILTIRNSWQDNGNSRPIKYLFQSFQPQF